MYISECKQANTLGSGCSRNYFASGFLNEDTLHFLDGCFTCGPDSFELVYWGTWYRSQRWGFNC